MPDSTSYLSVNMRSRKKTFYEGKADTLTSYNDKGEFDILCQHANFICLVKNYVTFDKGTTKEKKFIITSGVLRVTGNKADIFLDV